MYECILCAQCADGCPAKAISFEEVSGILVVGKDIEGIDQFRIRHVITEKEGSIIKLLLSGKKNETIGSE